jgi:hypothetical protein
MRIPLNFLIKNLPNQIKTSIKYFENNNNTNEKNSLSLFLEVYEECVKIDDIRKNLEKSS